MRPSHWRFIIERDGAFLANVPQRSKNPFGRPLFQNLQYSDTPTQLLVPMQFTDTKAVPGRAHIYRVTAVNTVGLQSKPSADSVAADSGVERPGSKAAGSKRVDVGRKRVRGAAFDVRKASGATC